MLDAAKRAEEIFKEMKKRNQTQKSRQLSSSDEEQATHATDISEPDGAKILQNLENLVNNSENLSIREKNDFIGDLQGC